MKLHWYQRRILADLINKKTQPRVLFSHIKGNEQNVSMRKVQGIEKKENNSL